jgi:hypothetical protein
MAKTNDVLNEINTYAGRLAASRASLNLLLALPAEANLRCCFTPEPTLVLRGGDTKAVPKFPFPPTLPNDDEGSGSGAALAAATDRDSKLDAASDCWLIKVSYSCGPEQIKIVRTESAEGWGFMVRVSLADPRA